MLTSGQKPGSPLCPAGIHLLLFPASSESRVENGNGDNVVSRENKRCEWTGRRVVKHQLLHGKGAGETRMQNLDKGVQVLKTPEMHGQAAIRTASRQTQALSPARH